MKLPRSALFAFILACALSIGSILMNTIWALG